MKMPKKQLFVVLSMSVFVCMLILFFSALLQPTKHDIHTQTSAGLTPDHVLYPFDLAGEWIQFHLLTSYNTQDRLLKAMALSQEKANEILKLTKNNQKSAYAIQSLKKHNLYLQKTYQYLQLLKQEDSQDISGVATKISELTLWQKQEFEKILKNHDSAIENLIKQTLANIEIVFEYSQDILVSGFLETDLIEKMRYQNQRQ